MKIYTTFENTSYSRKPLKSFTSFNKALHEVENLCGEILIINTPSERNPYDKNWYYKFSFSDVQWATLLLNRKNIGKACFFGKRKGVSYSIEETEVF